MKLLTEFDYKKATQLINFFAIKEGGQIDKLKVIKLIWLADRAHIRKYGRTITNDTYYAMNFGPVGSGAKDITGFNSLSSEDEDVKYAGLFLALVQPTSYNLESKKEVDKNLLSQSELEILEQVYENYGKYTGLRLAKFSHEFPEWQRYQAKLESKNIVRSKILITDFFENPKEKNSLSSIFNEREEELKNSKQIYQQHCDVAQNWL